MFQDSVTIAKELPLISNLNMIENIAIIEEFHNKIGTNDAHINILKLLKKIECEDIAYKTIEECTSLEIFYVMLLRAIMCDKNSVVIYYVYSLVEDLETIDTVMNIFKKLDIRKEILFIDSKKNEHLYGHIKLLDESKNGL